MTRFICGTALAIALVIVIAYVIWRRAKQSETTVHTEAPKEAQGSNELDILFGGLADCLLALRLSGAGQAVIDSATLVVDRLYALLPGFMEKHGGTELAFVLVQVGKKYLPNLLTPYSEMSRAAQQDKEQELLDALSVLLDQIKKVEEINDKGEVDRFDTEATLLRQLFLGESVEAS